MKERFYLRLHVDVGGVGGVVVVVVVVVAVVVVDND